jgi:lipase chaperone LimK
MQRAQIKSYLAALLRQRSLTAAQSAEVMSFFDRYWAYLEAADKSAQGGGGAGDVESLRATFEKRNQLRRQMLGLEMEDGFFGESEKEDQVTLERLAISNDRSLSEAERQSRLQALRSSEPLSMQQSERDGDQLRELSAETEALKKSGASESQIFAMRSQLVGEAAAERLQQMDTEDAQWNQRLDVLRQQQKQIVDTPGLSQQDKDAEVDAIIARDFSATEAARARALLKLH